MIQTVDSIFKHPFVDYLMKGLIGLLVWLGLQIYTQNAELVAAAPVVGLRLERIERTVEMITVAMKEGRSERLTKQADLERAIAVLQIEVHNITDEIIKLRDTKNGQ